MIVYERPKLTLAVDLAILTVRENQLQVLVIERGIEPYRGQSALPGGFVLDGEDLPDAARRELAEETGLDLEDMNLHLEQLATYGAPDRDPRGRIVRVAYLAIAPDLPLPGERARAKREYTTLAARFCGSEFTIGDLRHVYEVVWNMTLDPRNFSRKVANSEGFVEPTGGKRVPETGRPAALYRLGGAQALNPPLTRSGSAAPQRGVPRTNTGSLTPPF